MMRPYLLCSTDRSLARELQRTVHSLGGLMSATEVPIAHNAVDGLRMACGMERPLVMVDARLDEATDLLRALKAEAPDARRVAVSSYWVDPLRYAMQAAGATELLDTPVGLDRLRGLLGADAETAPEAGPRKGRLLCFLAAQSGNGASTIAMHLAHRLASRERQALLVELDFHSGVLACRMGIQNPKYTLADLSGLHEVEAHRLWPSAVARWKGLDVLLGPPSSNALASRGLPPVELVLGGALQVYDEVLADLPCSMNQSVRGVVAQAERVYLTATPEISSLHLAARRFQELRAAGVAESKVFLVLNRVSEDRMLDAGDVRRIVGIDVKYRLQNDFRAASEAEAKAEVLSQDSPLGRGLLEMAEELSGRKRSSGLVKQSLEWFFKGGRV